MPEQLVAMTLIYSLSLLGSLVFFKYLKSSAVIERKGYRVGGALAGFLLILSSLGVTYAKVGTPDARKVEEWKIVGKLDHDDQPGSRILVEIAPQPSDLTDNDGGFILYKVPVVDGRWPDLLADVTGQHLEINEETADFDPAEKRIVLKKRWKLLSAAPEGDEVPGTFLEPPVEEAP